MKKEGVTNRLKNRVALAAGALALLLFWVTLSPTAFPGESATLMATRLGIEPHLAPGHTLWFACTAPLSLLPISASVYALNLWSALCGALAVGLLCRYMTGWIYAQIVLDGELDKRQARLAALLAGGFAAFALATSIPFWVSATRLHFFTFHSMLLLLAFNLVQDYCLHDGGWRPYALALLCGAGCSETALFLVMTPWFASMLLVALYLRGKVSWWRMSTLAFAGLIGVSLYGVAAWQFMASGGAELRGDANLFPVVMQMVIAQVRQLQAMVPRTGWIWIALVAFLPWLAVQFVAGRGLNMRRNVIGLIFHIVLVVCACLVQSNASFLPWSASLPAGRMPVLEQLLTAMVIGYLAAFWFLRLADPALRDKKASKGRHGKRGSVSDEKLLIQGLAGVMGVVLALCTVIVAFENGACANGRRAAFADTYVKELLDQLQSRTWLVTDGLLDPQLTIAALCRGQPLNLINLAAERHPLQIRRLCEAITSDPVLAGRVAPYRNAANLGCASFLQEWLASDTGAVSRLAFYVSPDLLIEAGFTPQTDRLLFVAARDTEPLKARPLLDEHDAFWSRMDLLLQGTAKGDPIDALRGTLRRHVSMTANNLGVQLEDLGRPKEAYAAYLRALSFEPDNFSAMLNRVVLTRQGIAPEEKPVAESAAAAAFAQLKNRPDAGRLARFYGYVRVPGEFSKQSAEWMRFGQPKLATAALRRAMDLAPEEKKLPFLSDLAGISLSDGKLPESEALFKRVLEQAPLDIPALLGMVRVALNRADVAAARTYLNAAKRAGIPDTTYRLEDAAIDLVAGEEVSAQRKVQALTDEDPKLLYAWALQANLLLKQGKTAEVERDILPRMQSATGKAPHYLIALTQGFAMQEKGPAAYGKARECFMLAYKLNPGNRSVLTALLNLDFALKDAAATESHAAALLRIDRDDGLANYLMGTLLLSRDDLAGAEAHLRRSLAAKPSAPVCNDLAETLRRQGKLDEAEKAVRQALSLDPQNASAHDTLACVLLDAGRLPEARESSAAARALAPKAVPFKLTEVRILARTGDPVEARDGVRQLTRQADALSPRQRAELAAVAAELKKR